MMYDRQQWSARHRTFTFLGRDDGRKVWHILLLLDLYHVQFLIEEVTPPPPPPPPPQCLWADSILDSTDLHTRTRPVPALTTSVDDLSFRIPKPLSLV